ncbi:unnamed protein product [Ilex paraguariensis]|uniref:Carbohydrate kinase PfkB domain-containing protein n=1 Tax=Ilex paraguariensis TaxID=185542 RepID=A0ABC8UFH7_9AQUA
MAAFHLLPSLLPHHYLHHSHSLYLNSLSHFKISSIWFSPAPKPRRFHQRNQPKASINGDNTTTPEAPKATRRGRKKSPTTPSPPPPQQQQQQQQQNQDARPRETATKEITATSAIEEEPEDHDDGIDFPYEDPPLICCFGAAQKEFVPTVRVAPEQMHPDIYSQWKMLQWNPPEFVRAPGGPPSNVAISHVRLGGRAAFMGKVGDDEFGEELVLLLNKEKVQTRAVKFDGNARTAKAYMKIKFDDGKIRVEKTKETAEDSLLDPELNLAVLKEARMFHFNSEVLTSPAMHSALFKAISWSKKFDERSDQASMGQADIIEVTKQELEFLLDEEYYEKRRNYRPQYYAEDYEQTKRRRDYYHYTREEISPLWHDGLKFLFITDGTLRIHYYAPSFDGVVVGTEDVLITPFTCDRTGSGDAIVAGIMRKLTTEPKMYENQDILERQLRFAIAAGIISQWTIGAVRGFPTESATQNLKEQVYVPSMW